MYQMTLYCCDYAAEGAVCMCKEDEMEKTLNNTKASQAQDNVKDIQFYGDGDLFKCLSKAWSEKEGWMKSTKAMNVPHGVVIQVTTQQGDNIAEALTYVPGCHVEAVDDDEYAILEGSELDLYKKQDQ